MENLYKLIKDNADTLEFFEFEDDHHEITEEEAREVGYEPVKKEQFLKNIIAVYNQDFKDQGVEKSFEYIDNDTIIYRGPHCPYHEYSYAWFYRDYILNWDELIHTINYSDLKLDQQRGN